jgi:hypothetical protein
MSHGYGDEHNLLYYDKMQANMICTHAGNYKCNCVVSAESYIRTYRMHSYICMTL